MSGFGGFSFGNTQPTTTAQTSTFGSPATFGTANQQQQQQPMFGATATASQPAQQTTGFSAFGAAAQPQQALLTGGQQQTGSLFGSLNTNTTNQTAAQQPQQSGTGFTFSFGQTKPAAPATTTQAQAAAPSFGSSLFATSAAAAPTSQASTGSTSFNFNLGGTASAQQSTPFSLNTTAPASSITPVQPTGATPIGLTTAQPQQQSTSLIAAPTQQTTSTAQSSTANKSTTGGFSLNFGGQTSQPASTGATTGTVSTTTASTLPTSQATGTLTLSTPSTTATPAATNQAAQNAAANQQPTQMTFKQLEGYINVWLNELNQMEADFQTQSQTINSWDSLLVNNGLKITNVNENLDLLKEEYKRIDQQLDFVISQQNELEQLLEPLEKIQVDFNINDTASTEREFTYSLVDTVSNDLQGIGSELQNFIKKLNETKASHDLNDPLSSIGKILNSHIDALQYIEHQISVLKRNVES